MKLLSLSSDVTLISVLDDALLLDAASRCYFDLNDTAVFLLKSLEDGCSPEDLRTKMVARYDVDPESAASDIDCFIAELSRFNLLETREEAGAHLNLTETEKDKRTYHPPMLRAAANIITTVTAGASSQGVASSEGQALTSFK